MNISRELIQMRLQINFVPNASIQTTDCLEYKINATFYKKKEMFNSHEIKEKNNGIDYFFFVSYSERKSDIPSLLLFWPSLLWMPIQAENAWEYYYYEYVWPKLYIPSAIKNQMNLVDFCFWVDRAVLGSTENSAKCYFWGQKN